MNAMVLIMMMVCGEPVALMGWGLPIGVGPFFGTTEFVDNDLEVNAAATALYQHPDTQKAAFEVIPESEWKYKCPSNV